MSRSRALCIESALQHGVDRVAGPHYFDPGIEYRDGFTLEWLKSQPIYEQMGADWWWTQRGCGYWLWKPYVIDQVMLKLPDGDILVYADAGIEVIDNVSHIVDRMDQDIFLFGNNWEHAHWCKRDAIAAIYPPRLDAYGGDCGRIASWKNFGKQVQASVIFFRVSDYSRRFVAEWLKWGLSGARIGAALTFGMDNPERRDERATWSEFRYLIDDSPSVLRNHPEFREHRHDQAILTTMAYREGITLRYWPARYNDGAFVYEKLPEYAGDDYPILFHHHRRRNHEWSNAA